LTQDLVFSEGGDMSEAVVGVQSERMSWEQICSAFEGEWVLMVDVDWVNDADLDLRSAVVVSHGKHRQWSRARELIPDNTEITHLFIFKPGYEA
jgi:hypothetical protein